MNPTELVKLHRGDILATCLRHGARNVRVFGSVARAEAGPDSDVDILVELDPGRTLLDHAALLLELRELLGVKVDVVTANGLRRRIRDRVLAEALPL
jgi:predicted nucleotidyltransferase